MSIVKISLSAMKDIERADQRLGIPAAKKDILFALHRLEKSPGTGAVMFLGNEGMPYYYLRLDQYLIVYKFEQSSIYILRVLFLKYSNIACLFNGKPRKMGISTDEPF